MPTNLLSSSAPRLCEWKVATVAFERSTPLMRDPMDEGLSIDYLRLVINDVSVNKLRGSQHVDPRIACRH